MARQSILDKNIKIIFIKLLKNGKKENQMRYDHKKHLSKSILRKNLTI